MQVMGKGGICFFSQMVAESTQGKVHLCQTVGGRFLLLTVNVDTADVTLLFSDQIGTLDKHTTGAAAGIVQSSIERFDHSSDQLNSVVRRVKFAFFLGCVDRKLL